MKLRVLIIGGYGTFGGRLARLLADEAGLEIVVAGRSLAKAQAFCAGLSGAAAFVPAQFDRAGDVATQMRVLAPAVAVDASGPFQSYGDAPYRVVQAAIALGIHYIDLADATGFVCGINQFDAAARAAGVFVLSGVSSVPVLNFAAARALSGDMVRVKRLSGGIAPSPLVQVGLNVVRSICAGAGQPFEILHEGKPARAFGLTRSRRFTICPPGSLPLPSIQFCRVDTPDQPLAGQVYPGLREAWMGAGTRPELLLRLLAGLTWLVRWRILPSLAPFASLFWRASQWLLWGEHRGGMFVVVEGVNAAGKPVSRAWHLVAEGDNGPFIPAMASAVIIQKMLAGQVPPAGARPAIAEHELTDFASLFAAKSIVWGITSESLPAPLYRQVLGEAFERLPAPLQALHDLKGAMVMRGQAQAERGNNPLARLLAIFIGFPKTGKDIPVEVKFTALADGSEIWQRSFAGRSFRSVQSLGRGRWQRMICERFGPVSVALAMVVDGGKLRVIVRHWRFLGLPLPRWLAPGGTTYEFAEGGRFCFHVEIAHPLTGLIVRYRGWLAP